MSRKKKRFQQIKDWDRESVPQTVLGMHLLYCKSERCDLGCSVMEDLMVVWQQATAAERSRCAEIATRHRRHDKYDVGAGPCIADQIMSADDPDPIL